MRSLFGALILVIVAGGCGDSARDEQAGGTGTGSPAAPTASRPVEDVKDAVKRHFDQIDKGQYAREWDELHPLQQAFIPRDRWTACRPKDFIGLTTKLDKLIEEYQEPHDIPGTGVSAPSTAVTVQVTLEFGGEKLTQKHTVHHFLVDGRWRHTVTEEVAQAYKTGTCPA